MIRWSVVSVVVALSACGTDNAESSEPSAPSAEQSLTPQQPVERLKPAAVMHVDSQATARLSGIQAQETAVVAHSLAQPDGTRVKFLLGQLGCGIWTLASGEAEVHGGSFVIHLPADQADQLEFSTLFFRVADGSSCDPQAPDVRATSVAADGTADLSAGVLDQGGCFLVGE